MKIYVIEILINILDYFKFNATNAHLVKNNNFKIIEDSTSILLYSIVDNNQILKLTIYHKSEKFHVCLYCTS